MTAARTVPVLPAATVLLIRDGAAGDALEVCLLRRNLQSTFVGGAYLFPGGGVDASDHDPALAALCTGRGDVDASAALGLESGGLAFWIAAIREAFEEAGLLPATWAATGAPLRFDEAAVRERFAGHRAAVDQGTTTLAAVLSGEGLRLDLAGMHQVAHWVTPAGAPRRYDARFFLAAAPPGQELLEDTREVISAAWLPPLEALERQRSGAFTMLPPTISCLELLTTWASTDEALAGAAALGPVPRIVPRILTGLDGSVRIVVPGDDGYGEAHEGDAALPRWRP